MLNSLCDFDTGVGNSPLTALTGHCARASQKHVFNDKGFDKNCKYVTEVY